MSTRILIIEDEPLIARDLKRIAIKYEKKVVGICHNSDKALDYLAKQDYDIVLLDIHLQGSRNGIELASIINSNYKKPFIFITSFADRKTIEQAKITFPSGYVVKPFNDNEVFSAIEIAHYKEVQTTKDDSPLELNKLNGLASKPITSKERQIIQGIVNGLTNNQLSEMHHVSLNTIKTHIKSIYTKLEVHSKPELVTKIFSS